MERVLFTGLGSIGKRHLRLLQAREESFDIHAYRSGPLNSGSHPEITEHTELLSALSKEPDIAFITNPTSLHVETALKCARHGCHLFIEKPLSHTRDGVKELLKEVESQNLITCIGCQLRYHPVLQQISSLIQNDKVGDVYNYKIFAGSYLPNWRPQQDYRESYSAKSSMGGGVVLDLIHEIDYSYWLFGEVNKILAWTGNISHLEIESEDIAEVIFEMKSGVVGQLHLDYYRLKSRRTIDIAGQNGVIQGDLHEGVVELITESDERTKSFEFERDDLFSEQLDNFLTKVRAGEPCQNNLREGKQVLDIALEIKSEL